MKKTYQLRSWFWWVTLESQKTKTWQQRTEKHCKPDLKWSSNLSSACRALAHEDMDGMKYQRENLLGVFLLALFFPFFKKRMTITGTFFVFHQVFLHKWLFAIKRKLGLASSRRFCAPGCDARIWGNKPVLRCFGGSIEPLESIRTIRIH